MVQLSWDSTDLDSAQADVGMVHASVANTDYDSDSILKQGYDYANFSEIAPDPEACYPLHEDSGSTFYDVAGTNDGSYSGPTLGQVGLLGTTAPSLDGSNDEGTATTFDYDSYSSVWTFATWVYPRDTSTTQIAWMHDEDGSYGYQRMQNSSGTWEWHVYDGSSRNIATSTNLTANEWHHVVGQVVENDSIYLYVNGTLEDTVSFGTQGPVSSTLVLGSQLGAQDRYFDGKLADHREYSTELTDSEIQTIYDVVATPGELLTPAKIS